MNGSWNLIGENLSGTDKLSWRLMYIPMQLTDGSVLTINIKISPPPKLRSRAHGFQLLDDYRRSNQLKWMKEVRVKDGWCKCLIALDELRSFIRPLLNSASIVLDPGEEPTLGEDELLAMDGQILAPCAQTFGGIHDPQNPHESRNYLEFYVLIFYYQLENIAASQLKLVSDGVRLLQEEHKEYNALAFIMMRFGTTPVHDEITQAIRGTLKKFGIVGLRADERELQDDLLLNVLTYVHACDFGVAVFERVESNEFNPNVSLEVGYMMALGKPICLLKDATLKTLTADLAGKLYREFQPYQIRATLPPALESWLQAKRLVLLGTDKAAQTARRRRITKRT